MKKYSKPNVHSLFIFGNALASKDIDINTYSYIEEGKFKAKKSC